MNNLVPKVFSIKLGRTTLGLWKIRNISKIWKFFNKTHIHIFIQHFMPKFHTFKCSAYKKYIFDLGNYSLEFVVNYY